MINSVRSWVLRAGRGGPHRAPLLFPSSAVDNDSCGVEADTKHNDTDPCWGPLRRVDVYHVYLVSGLASARARLAGLGGRGPSDRLHCLVELFPPERRVCSEYLLGPWSRAGRERIVALRR